MRKTNKNTSLKTRLDQGVRGIVLLLYVLMILVVGLQILTRWFLGDVIGSSLPWTVNISQMLLVYITFIGAAVTSSKREHISLDLLVSRLSDRTIRALTVVRTMLILIFVGVLIYGAYPLYLSNRGFGIGALPAHPPFTQAWLYVPVIVGGVLIAVYGIRDIWQVLMDPETILNDIKGDDINNED
ncbi:TRAP transporter small permease [Halohasta litorea]|uniref:TRAP transporter small permease n=1 Tax=Halohasta litorea TaxID=869891 RepID=A0ABD6DCC4_9EURY|nr:TRAP transporter small permease [Halohasta litorea]